MKASKYNKKVTNNVEYKTAEEFVNSLIGNDEIYTSRSNILQDSTVLSCVDIISSTIATMSIQLFQATESGTKHIKNELTDLLSCRPNKSMNAFNMVRDFIKDMLINKDAYIYINHNKGKINELSLLDSLITTKTRVVGTNNYVIDSNLFDKQLKCMLDNVVHISDLEDRFKTIESIVTAKKYCSKLVSDYFKSDGSKPLKGILKTTEDLGEDAINLFLKHFTNRMQSTGYSMLDNSIDFQQISQSSSFQEMLINDLKSDLDNQIYMTYRVPKSLILGDGKESSYASLSVIQQQFVKSLMPVIKQIEQELNYKLLTEKQRAEGYYFKLNTKNALRMTDNERADYYKKMLEMGVYSINTVLELEDMDSIESGDSHRVSLNYCEVSIADEYQLRKSGAGTEDLGNTTE